MAKRGPKSRAEIMAPVPTALPRRPPPPRGLTAAGRKRWKTLVGELPVDRLRASDLLLLADLIRTEGYIRECDINIAAHGQVVGPGVQPNPALKIRETHIRIAVVIQRALRLCPSMRKRQDAADLQAKTAAKKPWEG